MTPEAEIQYCLEREIVERAAAAAAGDPVVADIHASLADRYADRACSLGEQAQGAFTTRRSA